ncbi:hypothetical protein [Streptomyces sp. YGL11-2]|uniref:hypothetical protein n=1 Tax=Streptomyces sp. YGL11-2 TaxID=3414028 RepID=UPI003CF05836
MRVLEMWVDPEQRGADEGRMWDLETEEPAAEIPLSRPAAPRAACIVPLPDGHHAVAIATAREITLWNPHTWTCTNRFDALQTDAMTAFPQSDATWLLATGSGTGLRLWDPRSGRLVHTLLTAAPVTDIVHTLADGPLLHIGGPAGRASLRWRPRTHAS